MRFNQGMTQREIGQSLGVSQMQVSRISRGGLKKLIAAVQGREVLTTSHS
jgi:DNA-directed RNA polymerase specialized sigma subunit